jgi:hypothetical protein
MEELDSASMELLAQLQAAPEGSPTPGLKMPQLVYHFTRRDSALRILRERKICLGELRRSNDPRETRSWSLMIDTPQDDSAAVQVARSMSSQKAGARFLCCTSDDHPSSNGARGHQRLRMWAQYGEKHKGACLVLDREVLSRQVGLLPGRALEGHISYNRHMGAWTDCFRVRQAADETADAAVRRHLARYGSELLLTKDQDWRDEAEYRFVAIGPATAPKETAIDLTALRGVIIGLDAHGLGFSIQDECAKIACPCAHMEWSWPSGVALSSWS